MTGSAQARSRGRRKNWRRAATLATKLPPARIPGRLHRRVGKGAAADSTDQPAANSQFGFDTSNSDTADLDTGTSDTGDLETGTQDELAETFALAIDQLAPPSQRPEPHPG